MRNREDPRWLYYYALFSSQAATEDLAPGARCFPAGKYLIYYRKGRSAIEIPHVFHGARDQARALKRARKE
jgi:plasmid stabilization system protein ParE